MNGRIYDPGNLQSYNRYSYVMNRPLSLTDPSGFTAEGFQYRFGGSDYQLYAGRITTYPIAVYDHVVGVLVTKSKWVPEYWIDENDEGHFMFVLETTFEFIAVPPVARISIAPNFSTYASHPLHGDISEWGSTKFLSSTLRGFGNGGKRLWNGVSGFAKGVYTGDITIYDNIAMPALQLASDIWTGEITIYDNIAMPATQTMSDAWQTVRSGDPDAIGNMTGEGAFMALELYLFKKARTAHAPKAGGRVFWSGGTTAREGAEAFARSTGGQTLEMTRTGKFLDAITTKKTYPYLKPAWNKASQNFARGADGAANVFQSSRGVRLESVWKTVEYPELIKAGNAINYHITP